MIKYFCPTCKIEMTKREQDDPYQIGIKNSYIRLTTGLGGLCDKCQVKVLQSALKQLPQILKDSYKPTKWGR